MDFLYDVERYDKIECLEKIKINPEDFLAHSNLANFYAAQKKWVPAIAEYRSSVALGNRDKNVLVYLANAYMNAGRPDLAIRTCESVLNGEVDHQIEAAVRQLSEKIPVEKVERLDKLNHNTFYRMKTLSDHLSKLFTSSDVSVLDIGGGEGLLSLFLPTSEYMLIEPTINGISALNPQIIGKKFDCVVACHVLEHIPIEHREEFLDSLCSLARRYVIMLNPFYDENVDQAEWQQMIFEITGAAWAKEHMDCVMPKIEDIAAFALKRNYEYRVIPNGSKMMTISMVFLDHYIKQVASSDEIGKINAMFNAVMTDKLINEKWPNAHLIEIKISG